MLQNERIITSSTPIVPMTEKAVDAQELAQALQHIPEAERAKLFYMMKGIELMGDQLAHKVG